MNLENNKLPETRTEPVILIALAVRHPLEAPLAGTANLDGNASPQNVIGHPQRQMSMGGYSGIEMSPINPQGSFASPMTPQVPSAASQSSSVDQVLTDEQRRQRQEAQLRGEALAREILGAHITAPTVSFLMPQAYQMQETEWTIIRQIYDQEPKAQDDLTFLSQLLEKTAMNKST